MKVLFNKILVKVEERKETSTKAGLFMPESSSFEHRTAEVIQAGEGTEDEPMLVEVGNKVIIGKYGGAPVKIDGEEYLVIEQKEILVVL